MIPVVAEGPKTKLYRDAIEHLQVKIHFVTGFPSGPDGKESACNAGDLGQEDLLEKGMTTHSGILAWSIPWTEEPVRLQSMESHRVRHD